GAQSGYSYHIATDAQLMTVELPVTLDLFSNHEIALALNVDQIFSNPRKITLDDETATTHSRTNDLLAARLRAGIERAFAVEESSFGVPASAGQRLRTPEPLVTSDRLKSGLQTSTREIAPGATPYRLTISRFFPQPALPLDNPLTEEGVDLGR